MNRKVFKQELADWNKNASFYQVYDTSVLNHIIVNKKLLVYDIPKIKQKILDLGAGTGSFANQLLNLGHDVVALDFSPKMARAAKKAYPRLPYIIASAEKLPFKDKSFDIIIADGVLHHVKVQEIFKETIEEIKRVLKNNAYLCIFDRNGSFISNVLFYMALFGKKIFITIKGKHFSSSATRHEIPFTNNDLDYIVKQGFRVRRRTYVSSFPLFLLIITMNALLYISKNKLIHQITPLLAPIASPLEKVFSFRFTTVEQLLKLQKLKE